MNKIKARAWVKSLNKYCDVHSLNFADGELVSVTVIDDGMVAVFDSKIVEIELGIGVADKNGKEIHEGDIITTPDWRTEPERELVEFSEITHGFNPFVIGCYECLAPEGDEVEVIGNIHENPELLKEEK